MRVLILGLGSMGRRHARNAAALGHDVAVCDPFCTVDNEVPFRYLAAGRQAQLWDPEAVVIATPAATHSKLLWAWREAPRLFVEKPLALSVADYWRFGSHGSMAAVGYQFRFHPHVRVLAREVKAMAPPLQAVFYLADGRPWPGKDYADILLEASHEIDLARHLFGSVTCVAGQASPNGLTWQLWLTCGDTTVKVYLSREGRGYERWAAVSDASGRHVVWMWHSASSTSILRDGQDEQTLSNITDQVYGDELRAWLGGTWQQDGGCDGAGGLAVLEVCDRARILARHASNTGV